MKLLQGKAVEEIKKAIERLSNMNLFYIDSEVTELMGIGLKQEMEGRSKDFKEPTQKEIHEKLTGIINKYMQEKYSIERELTDWVEALKESLNSTTP